MLVFIKPSSRKVVGYNTLLAEEKQKNYANGKNYFYVKEELRPYEGSVDMYLSQDGLYIIYKKREKESLLFEH